MLCSESYERVNAGDRTVKGERRTHSTTAHDGLGERAYGGTDCCAVDARFG